MALVSSTLLPFFFAICKLLPLPSLTTQRWWLVNKSVTTKCTTWTHWSEASLDSSNYTEKWPFQSTSKLSSIRFSTQKKSFGVAINIYFHQISNHLDVTTWIKYIDIKHWQTSKAKLFCFTLTVHEMLFDSSLSLVARQSFCKSCRLRSLTTHACMCLHTVWLQLRLTQRDASACVGVPPHAKAGCKSVRLPVRVNTGWSSVAHTVDWERSQPGVTSVKAVR